MKKALVDYVRRYIDRHGNLKVACVRMDYPIKDYQVAKELAQTPLLLTVLGVVYDQLRLPQKAPRPLWRSPRRTAPEVGR